MIPARLTVVTLVSPDVPALRAFYEGLGWSAPGPRGHEHAFVATGGAVLALWSRAEADGEVADAVRAAGHDFRGVTLAVNVDSAEEVDAGVAAARAAGARILAEPATRSWGGRSGYFADPEGNAWEVAHVPGATVSAQPAVTFP